MQTARVPRARAAGPPWKAGTIGMRRRTGPDESRPLRVGLSRHRPRQPDAGRDQERREEIDRPLGGLE